jgi:hypothetical protein
MARSGARKQGKAATAPLVVKQERQELGSPALLIPLVNSLEVPKLLDFSGLSSMKKHEFPRFANGITFGDAMRKRDYRYDL